MRILFSVWFVTSALLLRPISGHTSSFGQINEESPSVKLRGAVGDVRLVDENRSTIRWELKLKLRIVNEGNRPAILLRQDLHIGAVMLARSLEEANAGNYIFKHMAWPSMYAGPEWERWRHDVDSASPQPTQTWILTPGQSLSFDTKAVVNVEKAGNFDRTNAPWTDIKRNVKWLQIQIEPWPTNIEPRHDPENLEFGDTLQKRWKSFGELQLIRLTSEPMQLSFPQ